MGVGVTDQYVDHYIISLLHDAVHTIPIFFTLITIKQNCLSGFFCINIFVKFILGGAEFPYF